ncbi:MAG: Trm112 family protein [Promethearchaeota archaeon]
MKPWLLDILACPLDKFYPLKLYIFNFDTKIEEFNDLLETYEKRDIEQIKNSDIFEITKKDNDILIRDNISIEYNSLTNYINLILSSIKELENIIDNSNNQMSIKCLNLILSDVREKIQTFAENANMENINEILPELFLLNKFKVGTEIESGVLFCENCNRWYPIMETIPMLLSDEFRDEQKEKQFLSQAIEKNLLDDKFLKQDIKPYNI